MWWARFMTRTHFSFRQTQRVSGVSAARRWATRDADEPALVHHPGRWLGGQPGSENGVFGNTFRRHPAVSGRHRRSSGKGAKASALRNINNLLGDLLSARPGSGGHRCRKVRGGDVCDQSIEFAYRSSHRDRFLPRRRSSTSSICWLVLARRKASHLRERSCRPFSSLLAAACLLVRPISPLKR